MRNFGRVYSAFWQSPEIRALTEDARNLAIYLLSSPHGNLVGCFRLTDAYAADDLQWSLERVSEGFRQLSETGFLSRDEGTKWVFISKYLKWNAFENPNVAKAAFKAFEQVPSIPVKAALALALRDSGVHMSEEFRNACETLSEQYRKPKPEPEPEPKPDPKPKPKPKPISPAAAKAATVAPTNAVWLAYAGAYESRYQAPPVRNRTVNGMLAQLIERLGAEEAPEVAAFYLTHKNGLYVSAMHAVNLLLRDAEKLRTEWATGRQITRTQGQQADRMQTTLNAFAPMLAEARAREQGETDGERDAA